MAHPSHGAFRWMGGVSHVNSSQKCIFHWNTVELTAREGIFYGSGLTAVTAEEQATAKLDLYRRIRSMSKEDRGGAESAEFVCGRASWPGRPYKDPLPAKLHVTAAGQQFFVPDARMNAILAGEELFQPVPGHAEPKIEKIRSFVAGKSGCFI